MIQNVPSLREVAPAAQIAGSQIEIEEVQETQTVDVATMWASRITGAVCAVFLPLALVTWAVHQNHYRLVLAFLIVAMLAAILHSYTFDNG
jgi:L-asparagine transporter-like permease